MFNRDDLSEAVTANDRAIDAGGSLPALLNFLWIDPQGAVYVAEQRALRVAMVHSGVDPERIKQASEQGTVLVPRIHKRQRDLIPVYAGVWTDGLAAGVRAYHSALLA